MNGFVNLVYQWQAFMQFENIKVKFQRLIMIINPAGTVGGSDK